MTVSAVSDTGRRAPGRQHPSTPHPLLHQPQLALHPLGHQPHNTALPTLGSRDIVLYNYFDESRSHLSLAGVDAAARLVSTPRNRGVTRTTMVDNVDTESIVCRHGPPGRTGWPPHTVALSLPSHCTGCLSCLAWQPSPPPDGFIGEIPIWWYRHSPVQCNIQTNQALMIHWKMPELRTAPRRYQRAGSVTAASDWSHLVTPVTGMSQAGHGLAGLTATTLVTSCCHRVTRVSSDTDKTIQLPLP